MQQVGVESIGVHTLGTVGTFPTQSGFPPLRLPELWRSADLKLLLSREQEHVVSVREVVSKPRMYKNRSLLRLWP